MKNFLWKKFGYYSPVNKIKIISEKEIKEIKAFQHLSLVKQSRLSVMMIDLKSWKIICKMGKINQY